MSRDGIVRISLDGQGKAVDQAVVDRDGEHIYRQRVEAHQPPMAMDLSGRSRVSQLLTLYDGKCLNADDALKWHNAGTGTFSFSGNRPSMAVTAGQYLVRQARQWCPYYSGKPQLIETTTFNFHNEAGVVKRTGYFSSNAVAPYDADFDGAYIEADGTTHRLVCWRAGTKVHDIPLAEWDNGHLLDGYDWSKFTVGEVDFLWLGGAGLRLFFVVGGVFRLLHAIDNHAGAEDGLIFQSPQHPVRHEIRSSTGSGSFIPQCSQVATEGTQSEQGEELSAYSGSIACNTVGTIYALAGVRKAAGYRDHHIEIDRVAASIISATVDSGVLLLVRNPTLSAPLTWAAKSRIEEGTATTQTLTAGTGRVIAAQPMNTSADGATSPKAALRALTIGLDNVADQYVLAYQPTTNNQNVVGALALLEY
jgi:hypothetical protein